MFEWNGKRYRVDAILCYKYGWVIALPDGTRLKASFDKEYPHKIRGVEEYVGVCGANELYFAAEINAPPALEEHESKYLKGAWHDYTPQELGNWVHLLLKRAGHRADPVKKAKDISDAKNYLSMLESHVMAAQEGCR